MSQSELSISFGFAIDQSAHPEALRESFEFTERSRSFREIHEVSLHASLGEETERLTGLGVFLDSEDLYFHDTDEARVIPDAKIVSALPRAAGNLRQW